MPGIDYRQLRRQISMSQVLDLLHFQTTCRHGPQLRGPCLIPGCRSTSPRSFSVHLSRQVYHCFACGSHGNSLDLWAAVRHLSLHEAAVHLCRAVNLAPPWLSISRLSPIPRRSRHVASGAPRRNR
jgi:DNA primase